MKCIDEIPVYLYVETEQHNKYKIKCPSCSEMTTLPNDGSIASLPPAFHINAILELYHEMSKVLPVTEYAKCPKHHRDMEMFCEECEQLVCAMCAIREHGKHTCDLATAVFPKHKQEIEGHLGKLKQQLDSVLVARDELDSLERNINQQVESSKREVDKFVNKLIQVAGQHFKEHVGELAQPKLALIIEQTGKINILLNMLKTCEESVETQLGNGTQEEILTKKKEMVESMMAACQQISIEKPPSRDSLVYVPKEEFLRETRHIGKVVRLDIPAKELVDGTEVARCSGRGSVVGMVGVEHSLIFDLQLPSKTHQDISCYLYNDDKGVSVMCKLEDTTKKGSSKHKVYCATYTPTHSGLYYIILRDGDTDVPCYPSTMSVLPLPCDREQYVSKELLAIVPHGIAISKDDVMVVTEVYNNTIAIVREGQIVRRFGKVQLQHPTGVAFTPDECIIVVDKGNHRIQKFTADGKRLNCVGTKGSGKLQFVYPYDVAVDDKGRVYVSDTGNRRIQVLHPDLSFSHVIGKGAFYNPCGIAIDSKDVLYVCDDSAIYKVSPDGKSINKLEVNCGCCTKPYAIAVDTHDVVYAVDVAENMIFIFDSNSDNIHAYVPSQKAPSGIAVDSKDNIFYTIATIDFF